MAKKIQPAAPPPVPSTLPAPPNEDGELAMDGEPVAEGLGPFEARTTVVDFDGNEHATKSTKPAVEARAFVRIRPVRLTPEELQQRSKEMVEVNKAEARDEALIEQEKEVHKAHVKSLEALGKERRARRHELARILDSGTEDRDVDCVERRNDEDGTMDIVRLDTEEVLERRPMLPGERQRSLPFDGKDAAGSYPEGSKAAEWVAGSKVPPPAPPAEETPAAGVFGKSTTAKHVTTRPARTSKAAPAPAPGE